MHIPSGYSLVTCCLFDKSKSEANYYIGKDCMEVFCKDLKNQAMKIINYEKKEITSLTYGEVINIAKNFLIVLKTLLQML